MNTTKLIEALNEMKSHRNVLDTAIANIERVLVMLNGDSNAGAPIALDSTPSRPSYISDAVAVLEKTGHPLHIKNIVDGISQMRGQEVQRASVESSLIRHISSANGRARIAKVRPSTYALSIWKSGTASPEAPTE